MALEPLYRAEGQRPAFHLRFSWTAWPAHGPWVVTPDTALLQSLMPLWEADGMRLLEHAWSCEQIQLTFSTKPEVSPVYLAGRAKGRLQHALRKTMAGFEGFSRKLSLRSVGDNRSEDVRAYIEGQVDKEPFADPRFRDQMREFTVAHREVDLAVPSESARGRYWYNLHLVLVSEHGCKYDRILLRRLRDTCFKIAAVKGHAIAALAVMPDHVHMALRPAPEQSPQDVALAYLNNLAYAMGQTRFWRDGYYVGTFGEYDMGAVRAL